MLLRRGDTGGGGSQRSARGKSDIPNVMWTEGH